MVEKEKGIGMVEKIGRNDSCPCGSGKKYKSCCMLAKQSIAKTMEGKRKFTAKLISGGGMKPSQPESSDSANMQSVTPPDYTAMMERSFGSAIYGSRPPVLGNPEDYTSKEENNERNEEKNSAL